ncbi:MAG: phospholipase D-like domain-containing protein [Candidatus Heimdallarchaeaceae archaeon]
MKKKDFVNIIILGMLLFTTIRTSYTTNGISISQDNSEISTEAITTQTFTGTINVTTLVGPDYAYDVIHKALKNAQTSIHLEVYTLSSEPLVNALIKAHGRGVEVIVQLSDDRVNSFEDAYTEEAAYRMKSAGIDVYWTNGTEFVFTHSKFWIIDGIETFVYSGNWAPSSIPQFSGARKNREMGFLFNHAGIATYFENVFIADGLISTPYVLGSGGGSLQANETSGTYTPVSSVTTFNEYTEVTPIFAPDNSYELLSGIIDAAATSIDLELQYMKFDCDLLDDVLAAALRGVAIRVLIPEPGVTNENVTETLISHGIQVKFFKGLGHNHNKYVLVDGETVQISSINWSNNSVDYNRESGAIVKNSNIAAYYKDVFDEDWAVSETPTGFAKPVDLVSPKAGGIADGNFNFQASFSINTYTSGELLIDSVSVHTWVSPSGLVGHTVDTSTYTDGIHTVKVIGTPTVGPPIEIEKNINIVNTADWNLLITEVRYDADTEPDGEFVEIFNDFSFALAIEGWTLTDNEGTYTLPEGAQINANEVLVFARSSAAYVSEMSALGITVSAADYGLGDIALANTGDEILLKDPDDNVKDAVAWGSGSVSGVISWSGSSTGEDETLQRSPPNEDSDDCNADFVITNPTPGEVAPVGPEFTSFLVLPIISVAALVIIFLRRKIQR